MYHYTYIAVIVATKNLSVFSSKGGVAILTSNFGKTED